MPTTMKLIAKNVLGSAAASISFTSIPSTYTDLALVCSVRGALATTTELLQIRFNGASNDANLSSLFLRGNGSAAESFTQSWGRVGLVPAASTTSNTFGSIEVYIPNYSGSANKSYSASSTTEDNQALSYIEALAGLWASSAAITQIEIFSNSTVNLVSGSSFFLYGITKA